MKVFHVVVLVVSSLFTSQLFAQEMAQVVSVTDPATVVLSRNGRNETVRLAGLSIEGGPFVARATEMRQRAASYLVGRWVMVEQEGDAVWLFRSPEGTSVNLHIVSNGLAAAVSRGGEYGRLLSRAEREARENLRGAWNPLPPQEVTVGRHESVTYLGLADPAKGSSSTEAPPKAPKRAGGGSRSASRSKSSRSGSGRARKR
jgi:hypothetical protein